MTQPSKPVSLPKPSLARTKSVALALRSRRTVREIGDRKLSRQLLSDLLWAACGVNRKKGPFGGPGLTAATASNSQEIDVYVLLEDGAFLYDPLRHALVPVVAEDLRRYAIGRGQAGWGERAAVRLVFVADVDRLAHTKGFQEPGLKDPEVQRSYYFADTGLVAGNVYLFAASVGLAAWFHNCDKASLAAKLGLRKTQRPTFGQTIGYPAKTPSSHRFGASLPSEPMSSKRGSR